MQLSLKYFRCLTDGQKFLWFSTSLRKRLDHLIGNLPKDMNKTNSLKMRYDEQLHTQNHIPGKIQNDTDELQVQGRARTAIMALKSIKQM